MDYTEFKNIAEDVTILSDAGCILLENNWTAYIAASIRKQNRFFTLSENDVPQYNSQGVISIRNLNFDEISKKHIFKDHPYMKIYEILKKEIEKTKEEKIPHSPNIAKTVNLYNLFENEQDLKTKKLKPQNNKNKDARMYLMGR